MKQTLRKSADIFWHFLLLGCISFGGPAAHIGYFQRTFVEKLQWLSAGHYAQLIALSQFLPGPGSSQVGFAIGLQRAGTVGGIAAFLGFTLPSFLLMTGIALFSRWQQENLWFTGLIHGLKLLAVVVVADACLNMLRNFCHNRLTTGLAGFTAAFLLAVPGIGSQMIALGAAAAIGACCLRASPLQQQPPVSGRLNHRALLLFVVLLFGLPWVAGDNSWLQLGRDFYQSGSLVFGGGHVVLPLLQQTLGNSISDDRFLLGYAAAQAIPGPMFAFAAFLGAELTPATPWLGAAVATLAIFLPGFLLLTALHRSWQQLTGSPRIAAAVSAINAAVVGLLFSALYQPVFVSSVLHPIDLAAAAIGFYCLRSLKIPVIGLVIGFGVFGLMAQRL